ncbi:MAG: hypothetical protein KTR31_19365 [Myxococcales bacterium]|nr:hypothetical protein [Myxococcales bacterium]
MLEFVPALIGATTAVAALMIGVEALVDAARTHSLAARRGEATSLRLRVRAS